MINDLRDFIYDVIDIFMIIIIFVLVGFIVFTRVNTLMAMPIDRGSNRQPASDTISVLPKENVEDKTTAIEISVIIPQGVDAHGIGRILTDAGLISNSEEFIKALTDRNLLESATPGTYAINPLTTLDELINLIYTSESPTQ